MRFGEEARNVAVRHAPEETHAVTSFKLRAQRTVAREGECALAEPRKCICEAHDVLALFERADAEEARRSVRRGLDRELLEIDAARHDLRLPSRIRQLRLELAAQILGDADHSRCTSNDERRRRTDAREPADVAHVATVRRHNERRARAERRDQTARHEEVRVHDVRPPRAQRAARKLEIAQLAACTRVEYCAIDIVSTVE